MVPRLHSASLSLAACLALSAPALAEPLIEVVSPDPFTTYIQVNGTSGGDAILMGTLCDGAIGILRVSFLSIDYAEISAEDAASMLIVVVAGGGHDLVDTSEVAPTASLEIQGGTGDDALYGGPAPESMLGEEGNDLLKGGAGNDTLNSGPGFGDVVYGGTGDDSILDGDGFAFASGGEGADSIGVIFEAAWDNDIFPFNTRKSQGAIVPGGSDDFVSIIVVGSPILFHINADSGTTNPGIADELNVTGPIAPASTFTNFEATSFTP